MPPFISISNSELIRSKKPCGSCDALNVDIAVCNGGISWISSTKVFILICAFDTSLCNVDILPSAVNRSVCKLGIF